MNNQANVYCQSMAAGSEENRQVLILTLLSKLALVLFIMIYVMSGLRVSVYCFC